MSEEDEQIGRVAQEIERYLEAHPQAADSLEGIALWWITRQRIHAELEIVQAALTRLAAEGVVSAKPSESGQEPIYRLQRKKR